MLPVLVTLALLASSGAGGGLLHICQMTGQVGSTCPCPHTELSGHCATIQGDCCELLEVEGVPGSVQAASSERSPDSSPVLARLAHADVVGPARAPASFVSGSWWARPRAGPRIFLEVCSYLI